MSQGRYKCQALPDEAAVLSCMTCVDPNPIRAGIAENLESSVHTSAIKRIADIKSSVDMARQPLASIKTSVSADFLPISTEDYVDLID